MTNQPSPSVDAVAKKAKTTPPSGQPQRKKRELASVMLQCMAQRRLTQVASSLTYTTILAAVPLLAVVLSLFTAFPLFSDFREALENFFTTNLMPEAVSDTIMSYLNQFAAKASSLTAIGSLFLIITSIMLISTIDGTLNDIWQVNTQRPLAQRLLVYWALLSLGPILGGASLWATTMLARESMGYISSFGIVISLLLSALPFLLTVLSFTALFTFVPNCHVRWRDALVGGVLVAFCLELLKAGFAFYLTKFPTYTLIYGAFATIPIFLLWVYLSWLVVLLGASFAAILPDIRRHRNPTEKHYLGESFLHALSMLHSLWQQRGNTPVGIPVEQLSDTLGHDAHELTRTLLTLKKLGYVANTQEKNRERWVLACDPAQTDLAALVDTFLLNRSQPSTEVGNGVALILNATLASPTLRLQQVFEQPGLLEELSVSIQKQLHTSLNAAQEPSYA
ncbi:YihY family inner membrane protein [Paenalcaligenes suwonensis]|uniref:YihY family inner membrane protein n=1 Tax=Paenalcaligenes suwonensis TaxID=1202713 RepID=UPI001F608B1C|nr:YihY family inner membrane protein [Paenalcaligenes suwonensis]